MNGWNLACGLIHLRDFQHFNIGHLTGSSESLIQYVYHCLVPQLSSDETVV